MRYTDALKVPQLSSVRRSALSPHQHAFATRKMTDMGSLLAHLSGIMSGLPEILPGCGIRPQQTHGEESDINHHQLAGM